jgi:pectate lyase
MIKERVWLMRLKPKIIKTGFIYLWLAGATAFASPDFSMIGYAAVSGDSVTKTTGGAGGDTVKISTLSALQSWADSREKNTTPEVVLIQGKISSDTTVTITIKNGANISIVGQGTTGELEHVGLNIRDYSNVIVRYLTIHEVLYPDDALTLDDVRHGWVDHCELYSKIGVGITMDTYDGLLDIKKGSCYITISWCHLHDHMKCSLIGHTDNANQREEDGQITVTYHHNWFNRTSGRNPSLRFGAVHMFNNYYDSIFDYGLAARDSAHAKVENCHYNRVRLPMATNKFQDTSSSNYDKYPGFICESGNIFTDSCGADSILQSGCDYWTSQTLPYSYDLDEVSTVEATVKAYTGTGKTTTGTISQVSQQTAATHVNKQLSIKTAVQLSSGRNIDGAEVYSVNGSRLNAAGIFQTNRIQGVFIVKSPVKTVKPKFRSWK